MTEYRNVFPCHDWDDEWYVNQIMNLSNVMNRKDVGFVKGVPNEEVKSSDDAIRQWIDDNMKRCSCVIVFAGEKTYQSRWCLYEMELANKLKKGRFIIFLDGMKGKDGTPCGNCPDPYAMNGRYKNSPNAYVIKAYHWAKEDGVRKIKEWIEDACRRVS